MDLSSRRNKNIFGPVWYTNEVKQKIIGEGKKTDASLCYNFKRACERERGEGERETE